jgi:hypothetical protein
MAQPSFFSISIARASLQAAEKPVSPNLISPTFCRESDAGRFCHYNITGFLVIFIDAAACACYFMGTTRNAQNYNRKK